MDIREHCRAVVVAVSRSDLWPYSLRARLLRAAGATVGQWSRIEAGSRFTVVENLTIGENAYINYGCLVECRGGVVLEDNVALGPGVSVLTTTHDPSFPVSRAGPVVTRPVTICAGAWVGANSTVLPGVTIGAGALVGANSLVTRDVPANKQVVGSPAREVRDLPV